MTMIVNIKIKTKTNTMAKKNIKIIKIKSINNIKIKQLNVKIINKIRKNIQI
jgi:hypothetical protein